MIDARRQLASVIAIVIALLSVVLLRFWPEIVSWMESHHLD
jgi:hypothetical protein